MKRVTLKDIAERCHVTPALVSAVLNHRLGKISCQASKRALIESVALELGYHANVLASAMASHRIPVIGLMLNLSSESFSSGSRYFSDVASSLALSLHGHGLETLIVFYGSEDEQLTRFRELYGKSLIGGVVSNLIPRSNRRFIEEMKRIEMPYVLWGEPDVSSVSVRPCLSYDFVSEYHRRHGTSRCYVMQDLSGHLMLYPHDSSADYYRFRSVPVCASEALLSDSATMIIVLGSELYLRCGLRIAHPFIMERSCNRHLLPSGIPYQLSSEKDRVRADLTANLLSSWVLQGQVPSDGERLVKIECLELNWQGV